MVSVEETSSGLCLHLDHAVCTLQAVTPNSFRVRMVTGDEMPDYFSYATLPQTPPVPHFSWQESDGLIHFDTDAMKIVVRKHPFGFIWQDGSGQSASGSVEKLAWRKSGAFLSQHFDAKTTWYGLGERAFHLALERRTYTLTTTDPEVYGPNDDPLYINIPFLLGVHGGKAFGLLFDRMSDGFLTLRQDGGIDYRIQGNEVRMDVITGPGPADVLARYADLTGHAPLPPLWALGYHQSRWSYESEAIVRDIASNFRNRQIPCDAIHFDIDYMDGFRCFTWNHDDFPDPKGLISDLHQDGFRAVGMIDPGIKVDQDYDVCADGVANDVFCKLPDGSLFHGPVWPGECYFPDFTSPRVRKWWGKWYRRLLDVGFDGFWNDMNEPTIFGRSTFPPAVQHDLEGRSAAHWQVHSAYGMQMVRATFEGLNALRPEHRNWVFTRSAYAGAQRYASCWTADNASTWEDLQITPAMLMNLGLSGMAFTGSDIGGFAGTPTPELYARWISMGAFQPFFRTHTIKHSPWQEPWRYGEEIEAVSRKYITLRYRLLPAIYTLFWQYTTRGAPMMRPMFFEDPTDEAFLLLDDQWLFGDHLLVAPVLEKNMTARQVLLPAGDWYDFWTDERLSGKQTVTRSAPLDVVPIYVRAGAVLPMGPEQQFTGEKPTSPLTLHLYPGSGVSWLYEDDGETLAYRSGVARASRFEMKKTSQGLILERQISGDYTPLYTKTQIIFHGVKISHATLDGRSLSVLNNQIEIDDNPWRQLIATFN
ncbi:MAG: alpha-glucosidase [Clostridia bacterium]|nr:MAG: alpha-glucosidase [Clostridia bacterium]